MVFITVGKPAPLGSRLWIDLSPYRTLSVEMRGEAGGEQVYIGIKDNTQRDTGKIEFVFEKGIGPETIYFRNIQYLP